MRDWNARAFAAFAIGATCLAAVLHYSGETNHGEFISSVHAQPPPIRRLIEWLRSLTLPAGIVRAEGLVEATQIDVPSKYAGEIVDVAVEEGDKVAAGQVIARLRSPELEAQLRNAESDLRSAKEAQAQDGVKTAQVKVERIKSMISGLTLVSPRAGKVQYRLAHAGDTVAAGAPIVTLIDLGDVYMTVFLRAADASKLAMGDEARIILDAAPDYVVPAMVGFVASEARAAPKAVETKDDLAKPMLRVDLTVDPKVVETYYGKVETGLRGAGFVRTRTQTKWPADLLVKLPPAPVAQEPKPAPAPVPQEAAAASAPIGGTSTSAAPAAAAMSEAAPAVGVKTPMSEPATQAGQAAAPESVASSTPVTGAPAPVLPPPTPAPAQPLSAPVPESPDAPLAQSLTSSRPTQEAKLAPPPSPRPASPIAPTLSHQPGAHASISSGLGPELAAGFAPESLAVDFR